MKKTLGLVFSLSLATAVGCGGDDEVTADASPTADAAQNDAPSGQAVTINFSPRVTGSGGGGGGGGGGNGMEATCGTVYTNQGSQGDDMQFIDMRLYVSNVRLINDQSQEVPVALDTSSPFQSGSTTLLDFEDGNGLCAEGTAETNVAVTGTVPAGTYNGIVFDLGVPFDDNHDDVTAASSPLNIMSLYWAWLTGHKFAKIDVQDGAANRWNFHLGSTSCANGGGGPTAPPTAACTRPNLPTISIAAFNPASDTINIDLGALFIDTDFAVNTAMTPPGCQSFLRADAQGMTDPDCTDIFANVGLDLDTGACVNNCDDQTVFKVAQ